MPGKRGHEVPAGAAPSTEDPGYRAQGLSGTEGGVPGSPARHLPAAGCHPGAIQSQGPAPPLLSTPERAAPEPGRPRSGGLGAQ